MAQETSLQIDEAEILSGYVLDAPSPRLIDRVHAILGGVAVDAPDESGITELSVKSRRESLGIAEYVKTPANMLNFLSYVMPQKINDDIFRLNPDQACLLAHDTLELFIDQAKSEGVRASRRANADLFARHIGLYAEPKDADVLALTRAVGKQEMYAKLYAVKKVVSKLMTVENVQQLLDGVYEE